jgi:uncharacterized protein
MVTVDGHPVGAPVWYELMTHDGGAASDFYPPLLGWGVQNWPRGHGDYLVCNLGERAVAGIDEPTGPHTHVPTGWLVYFQVADIDSCAERIARAGGSTIVAPTELVGAGRYLMARDPFGAVFGTWEPHGHIGSGVVAEPGAPGWTELWLRQDDQSAAMVFYGAVLGVTGQATADPDGLAGIVLAGGRQVAGLRDVAGHAPQWVPFFGVADLVEASDTAARAGAEVGDRIGTPVGDSLLLVDPGGAHVGLVEVHAGK